MAYLTPGSVVRQIGSLFEGGAVTGLTDRQLLERFNASRDAVGEAAFAALVNRHGPMVLHVCRQLVGDLHHAEDAFQAVFLVLARRAQSIRDPDLLGNWLYGVAARTARCTKLQLALQRNREEGDTMRRPGPGLAAVIDPMVQPADQPAIDREQAEALHCEINRLPKSFRLPVVLCYFEGLTLDEAARRLRCPAGTVGSRLARARNKLRRSLTRRGVVLPAAALATALAPRSASASISFQLCRVTTKAAIQFAAGQAAAGAISASTMALAREVLRSTLVSKLRFLAIGFMLLGGVATGAGYMKSLLAMNDEPKSFPAGPPPVVVKPDDINPKPGPGRMIVVGRVLDPSGNPAVGVPVDVFGRSRTPELGADAQMAPYEVLGRGATDSGGRFHLEATRTASSRFFDVIAVGLAPGFGLGWAGLNPDAEQPAGDIRLRPAQVVRLRLVDVRGMPAAGVAVRVQGMGQVTAKGTWDGVSQWSNPNSPEGLRAWPSPLKTDDEGRLVLTGIGRDLSLVLTVRDLRFARQDLRFDVDRNPTPKDKEMTIALQPATIIEGRALAADTGKPIPDAAIIVESVGSRGGWKTSRFHADDRGRFQANPFPATRFRVRASPPSGQPYLLSTVEFAWTKGAVKKEIDVKLPRGVLIQGKVAEEGTSRPVGGANLHFFPRKRGERVPNVACKEDGSFQATVPPGEGHILVFGPALDHIPKEIGSGMVYGSGRPGGVRFYPHDIIAYQVKAGEAAQDLVSTLRPGTTVRGHVVGPDGETVAQAAILTRLDIDPANLTWRKSPSLHTHDGRFELHGLDPEKTTPVYFLDADHQWGATIELSGKQAGGEVTVRLQPCGQARARFVGPDGKPVANLATLSYIELLMTAGPPQHARDKTKRGRLEADATFMANVDPGHYRDQRGPASDGEGRINLPDLIPGALYRISDYSIVNDQKGLQVRKDFTVKPGETLDLGDILIEKPGS